MIGSASRAMGAPGRVCEEPGSGRATHSSEQMNSVDLTRQSSRVEPDGLLRRKKAPSGTGAKRP